MKKTVFLAVIALLFVAVSASAQGEAWGRKNYFNVSWVDQTLEVEDSPMNWKSEYGVALTKGTTYYLHKKPLFGMVKFGIDWTQIDLNYAKLEEQFVKEIIDETSSEGSFIGDAVDEVLGEYDFGRHQAEAAMHIGPSITINPVDHLKINGYFRYAPSFSAVIYENVKNETQFGYGYGSFFVAGGAISYKVISLGAEYRWGKGKYNNISFDADEISGDADVDTDNIGPDFGAEDVDVNVDLSEVFKNNKNKMHTSSLRVYVSLRF